MYHLVENHQVVSIIGMAKNVGKTTTLNYLIKKLSDKKTLGLTSIGRDGEDKDLTLDIPKPRIYVNQGAVIALATKCLEESDFTKQILETTGIFTPLGEVVIVRALSDGFVELAGPSINIQLKEVIKLLQKHGANLILIDGAFNRKAQTSLAICDGVILCTGASYSSNIDEVVSDTTHLVNLLTLPEVDDSLKPQFKQILSKTKVALIDRKNNINLLNLPNIVRNEQKIIAELNENTLYLLVNGALTDEFINKLASKKALLNNLTLVVKHGTNCLFSKNTLELKIRVLNRCNLLCLTFNPTSPFTYQFDEQEFLAKLKTSIKLPIFNVKSGDKI